MKTLIFIPVYNEFEHISSLLKEWDIVIEQHANSTSLSNKLTIELLLVNNGSNDGSEKILHDSKHQVLEIAENKGIGYSYLCAIKWALEHNYDYFGVCAGNGKMNPEEFHRLINPIVQNEFDYTKGSRYLPGGSSPNLPLFRNFSIQLVNFFVFFVTGRYLTDSTCGYRAFRLDLFRNVSFSYTDPWMYTYGFEYFIDGKAVISPHVRFKEVPVTMRYKAGIRHSKIRISNYYSMLKPWVIARFEKGRFIRGPAANLHSK